MGYDGLRIIHAGRHSMKSAVFGIALIILSVLTLTLVLTPRAGMDAPTLSADEGDAPTGKLKASRTVVEVGDTTTVTVYDISPTGTSVRLSVSGPLAHGGCEETGVSDPRSLPLPFDPPISVEFIACGPMGAAAYGRGHGQTGDCGRSGTGESGGQRGAGIGAGREFYIVIAAAQAVNSRGAGGDR